MIHRLILGSVVSLCLSDGSLSLMAENRVVLTNEHADLRVLYEPERVPSLWVVARDEDRRINRESTNVVLLVPEAARLELPPGTPFGAEGDSLWILPQNQFADLLYLGFSAEQIPSGIFDGTLAFQLRTVTGPGSFFAWQASSFGEFLIKFNSADGVSEADRTFPLIGSHEHFNWGFSAPGVYAVTFQVEGRLASSLETLQSIPTTFLFHVLPLPPPHTYEEWSRQLFHPELPESIRGELADPDGDGLPNVVEFIFGTDPCKSEESSPLRVSLEPDNDSLVGVLRFPRRVGLRDGQGVAEVSDRLEGPWNPMEERIELERGGEKVRVTAFDSVAALSARQRFYRVRWK